MQKRVGQYDVDFSAVPQEDGTFTGRADCRWIHEGVEQAGVLHFHVPHRNEREALNATWAQMEIRVATGMRDIPQPESPPAD